MSKKHAMLLTGAVVTLLAGCGPHVDLLATRSRRMEKDGKLKSVLVESMFLTKGLHGAQLQYEVDVLDAQKRPIMATHRHYRNEKGQVAGSRIVLGEEMSGDPSHVDVEIPVDMLGVGESELPAYAQVHLSPVNGGPGAETTVELPLKPTDVEGMGGPPAYASADQPRNDTGDESRTQPEPSAARDNERQNERTDDNPQPDAGSTWHDRVVPDDADRQTASADRNAPRTRGDEDASRDTVASPQSTPPDDDLTYWSTDQKPLPKRNDTAKSSKRAAAPHDDRVAKRDAAARPAPTDPYAAEIAELESAVSRSPNDLGKQMRLRMLYLARHQEGKALAPVDGTDSATSAKIDEYLAAVLPAVREGRVDPATVTLDQLDQWVERAKPAKRLKISDAAFCRTIDGFGNYRAYAPPVFPSRRMPKFLIYLQVENYVSTRARTGVYRTLLSVQQKLLNSAGVEVWSTLDQEIPDLSNGLRKDFFLAIGPVDFQQNLPADEYTLVISLRDVLGDTSCEKRMRFRVTGR